MTKSEAPVVQNLAYNNITELRQEQINDQLQALVLSGNRMRSMELLQQCQKLVMIHADSAGISQPQLFLPLINHKLLSNLILRNNKIVSATEFPLLKSLKLLDLSCNPLDDSWNSFKLPTRLDAFVFGVPFGEEADSDFCVSGSRINALSAFKNLFLPQYLDHLLAVHGFAEFQNFGARITQNYELFLTAKDENKLVEQQIELSFYSIINGVEIQKVDQISVKLSQLLKLNAPLLEPFEFHLPELVYPTRSGKDKKMYFEVSRLRNKQLEVGQNYNLVSITIGKEIGVFLFDKINGRPLNYDKEEVNIMNYISDNICEIQPGLVKEESSDPEAFRQRYEERQKDQVITEDVAVERNENVRNSVFLDLEVVDRASLAQYEQKQGGSLFSAKSPQIPVRRSELRESLIQAVVKMQPDGVAQDPTSLRQDLRPSYVQISYDQKIDCKQQQANRTSIQSKLRQPGEKRIRVVRVAEPDPIMAALDQKSQVEEKSIVEEQKKKKTDKTAIKKIEPLRVYREPIFNYYFHGDLVINSNLTVDSQNVQFFMTLKQFQMIIKELIITLQQNGIRCSDDKAAQLLLKAILEFNKVNNQFKQIDRQMCTIDLVIFLNNKSIVYPLELRKAELGNYTNQFELTEITTHRYIVAQDLNSGNIQLTTYPVYAPVAAESVSIRQVDESLLITVSNINKREVMPFNVKFFIMHEDDEIYSTDKPVIQIKQVTRKPSIDIAVKVKFYDYTNKVVKILQSEEIRVTNKLAQKKIVRKVVEQSLETRSDNGNLDDTKKTTVQEVVEIEEEIDSDEEAQMKLEREKAEFETKMQLKRQLMDALIQDGDLKNIAKKVDPDLLLVKEQSKAGNAINESFQQEEEVADLDKLPIQIQLLQYSDDPRKSYELYVACLYSESEPKITVYNQINVENFNKSHTTQLSGFNQSLARCTCVPEGNKFKVTIKFSPYDAGKLMWMHIDIDGIELFYPLTYTIVMDVEELLHLKPDCEVTMVDFSNNVVEAGYVTTDGDDFKLCRTNDEVIEQCAMKDVFPIYINQDIIYKHDYDKIATGDFGIYRQLLGSQYSQVLQITKQFPEVDSLFLEQPFEAIMKKNKKKQINDNLDQYLGIMLGCRLVLVQFDEQQMKNDCFLQMQRHSGLLFEDTYESQKLQELVFNNHDILPDVPLLDLGQHGEQILANIEIKFDKQNYGIKDTVYVSFKHPDLAYKEQLQIAATLHVHDSNFTYFSTSNFHDNMVSFKLNQQCFGKQITIALNGISQTFPNKITAGQDFISQISIIPKQISLKLSENKEQKEALLEFKKDVVYFSAKKSKLKANCKLIDMSLIPWNNKTAALGLGNVSISVVSEDVEVQAVLFQVLSGKVQVV